MYIHLFMAGIVATLIAEIAAMFIAAVVMTIKRGKKHGN